uniref:Uncharacterized protein n=1 Tax=Moniliophthora roreri TaxID=221103 RepID=A0A0W0GFU3_MONRR
MRTGITAKLLPIYLKGKWKLLRRRSAIVRSNLELILRPYTSTFSYMP